MNTHLKRANCFHVPMLRRVDAQQLSYWRSYHFLRRLFRPFETWVIVHEGRLRGFVVGRAHDQVWVIYNCCVDKAFHRQGLGSQLLRHVLQRAIEKGFGELILEVAVSNEGAIGFYQRHGFTIRRRLRDMYRMPKAWVDGYEMVCDTRGWRLGQDSNLRPIP